MATDQLPQRLRRYIENIPKAELHVHVEGTLEPKLMFHLAERNGVKLQGTVESHVERRRNFKVSGRTFRTHTYSYVLSLSLSGSARLLGSLL